MASVHASSTTHASKLTGIEAGRGVAALLVVFMHVRDHLIQASGHFPLGDMFRFGHAGVDFFFVLSGFIILHVHAPDLGRPRRLGHYLRRRFTRIYPFYWIVLALALLAAGLSPRHPFPALPRVVVSALLIPVRQDLVVAVAWTLQHEITFYAAFATLILSRRLGAFVLAGWLALIACHGLGLAPSFGASVLPSVTSAFDLEFFLGLLAAVLLRHSRIPYPRLLLLLGMAAFISNGIAEDLSLVRALAPATHLGYAAAAMAVILGAVEAERQGTLRVPRLLLALGGASYAIYLTHLLTVGALWQVLLATRLAHVLPAWTEFLLLATGAVVVGWAMSRLIEVPVTGFVRRLLTPDRMPSRRPAENFPV